MSAPRRIASRDNPHYRALLQLMQSARQGRRSGRAVLEGIHLAQAWCARFGAPHAVYVSDSAAGHPEVRALLAHYPLVPIGLSDGLFAAASSLEHGVGLLCVVDIPQPAWPAAPLGDIVYLDRVQDPGNVGTLLRTCAAAGIATVVTAPATAWCWSSKVLRAAMGAHGVLQIHEGVPWSALQALGGGRVVGTAARAPTPVFQACLRAPVLWVFGNEGQGISAEVAEAVTQWVSIPQAPGVESLNVAGAAAICLFEQRRQRWVAAAGSGCAPEAGPG